MELNKRRKLFFRFLKENNIYKNFIYEFKSYAVKRKKWIGYNEWNDNIINLIKFCNDKNRNEFIYAFDWSLTKNILFWGDISRKWDELIDAEKNKIYYEYFY